jgi:hypothetical protein
MAWHAPLIVLLENHLRAFGREDRVVLEREVEMDVRAVITLEDHDGSAMVDPGPKLRVESILLLGLLRRITHSVYICIAS